MTERQYCQKEFERCIEDLVTAHCALSVAKQRFRATLRGIVAASGSGPARAALKAATERLMAVGVITEETLLIADINNQKED